MMDAAARCLCDERAEEPRTTKSGYTYYKMAPGCPEHDARQHADTQE